MSFAAIGKLVIVFPRFIVYLLFILLIQQPIDQVEEDTSEGRKSKRTRLPTQPYQSPIPELQFIAKLQTPAKTTPKPSTEKIIAFYK